MAKNTTFTIIGLNKLRNNFIKAPVLTYNYLNLGVKKAALIATQEIKNVTPVKTGTLKRGIRPEFGNLEARIRPHNAPYAIFVHEPTRPHIIRPKRKKALYWKGAKHPVSKVRHPGTKGNPFMEKGLENAKDDIEREFKITVDMILEHISRI